ncbi:hypothetical protein R1flu_002591 [Riccia fluitans]|uniref:PLAT domain-containing protein n=1 Tax=Riccia fluitans TaxID=41844 RepID=A0ABD1Y6J8_9MARC
MGVYSTTAEFVPEGKGSVVVRLLTLCPQLQLLYGVPLSLSTAMMIADISGSPKSSVSGSSSSSSSVGRKLQQQSNLEQHQARHVAMSLSNYPETHSSKHQIQRESDTPVPSSQSSFQLKEADRICIYKIEVKTGTAWGAGTDSTIGMQLTGMTSSSRRSSSKTNYTEEKQQQQQQQQQVYFELDNDSDNFESGNVDVFQFNTKCVTNICRMALYTDHKGWFADWLVETVSVSITDGAPAEQHKWILDQWLPTTGGSLSVVKDNCNQ